MFALKTSSGPSVEIMLCLPNRSESCLLSYRFVCYYLLTKTLKRIDIVTYLDAFILCISARIPFPREAAEREYKEHHPDS